MTIPRYMILLLVGIFLFSACGNAAPPAEPASPSEAVAPIAISQSAEPKTNAAVPTAEPKKTINSGSYAYTDGNEVRGIVIHGDIAYAATLGGMVTWNLTSGNPIQFTPLQGMTDVNAYSTAYCEIPEPRILVGTETGISIYDPDKGIWEKREIAEPESNLAGARIDRIYCDLANNRMIVGSSGVVVVDLDNGSFKRFTKKDGLLWDAVTDIDVVNKDIWVANGYNGIAKITGDKITNYGEENGIPDRRASSLAVAQDGTLWVGASTGMMSFKGGAWKLYGEDTPAKLRDIYEIEISPEGKIWAATANGRLCQFNPKTGDCDAQYKDPGIMAVRALGLSADSIPVFATDEGVFVYENESAKHFKTQAKIASNTIDAIATAPDGKLWLGTGAGLYIIDPSDPSVAWEHYAKKDTPGMGAFRVSAIAFGPEDTAWLAMNSGAANRFKNGEWTSYEDIYSFDTVTVDAQGRAWFGDSSKGIIVLNPEGSVAMRLTEAEGLPAKNVQALVTDKAGVVWIGTDQGLGKYENDKAEIVFGKDSKEIPNKYIRGLALDADDALLIGTFTGVSRYDGKKAVTVVDFLKEDFFKARLTCLTAGDAGSLWIGTDRGVLHSTDGSKWEMITTQNGMLTNFIHALHVDANGSLWVGGGGLLQIVP